MILYIDNGRDNQFNIEIVKNEGGNSRFSKIIFYTAGSGNCAVTYLLDAKCYAQPTRPVCQTIRVYVKLTLPIK